MPELIATEHADFEGIEIFVLVLGEACSIILREATEQILEQAERSVHDALCLLTTYVKEANTVAGAGASETPMSSSIESQKFAGSEALAVDAIRRALTRLPAIICDNIGSGQHRPGRKFYTTIYY